MFTTWLVQLTSSRNPLERKALLAILLSLSITIFGMHPGVGETQFKLLRTLEARILLNSTVLVRVSSTPGIYNWQYFKDSFYSLNKSYWHSQVIDMIVEAFSLTDYRVIGAGEDEAKYAFIIELIFQLNASRRYVYRNGTLSFLDAFKPRGEYFSSVKVESERKIYDCTPRDKAWPRIWYSTQRVEWRNADFSDAPDNYEIFFKIPLRVVSNLPTEAQWRIYVDSKPVVNVTGNSSLVYVEETDTVSVEKTVAGRDGVRYVCSFPSLQALAEVNRTLFFSYAAEYRISLDSTLNVDAVFVNGYKHSLPYEFWVSENASVSITVVPAAVEGSFTTHVFDGWVDSDGSRLDASFTVDRPMRLTVLWREELNLTNIAIVVSTLVIAFLIPELRKRVSVEIVWEKPSGQVEESKKDKS